MRLALAVILAVALAGCGANIRTWHGMPGPIEPDAILPVSNWAGTPVLVEDGRARPTGPTATLWVDRGLTWDGYLSAVVRETRAALLHALGPARAEGDTALRVVIRENVARFVAPNWVGTTVLDAEALRRGVPMGQRWTARAEQIRWNWNGYATARLASQRACEAALKDLLRQLALSRPTP